MLAIRIVFISLSVLALAVLWYAFRPQASVPRQPVQASAAEPAAKVSPPAVVDERKAFELVVRDGKRVSGPSTMQVRQGDRVSLRIESNANDELHLHGYDLKLRIKGGEPATLEFDATRSGRFEIELHKRHTQLGAVEVYPK